MTNFPGMTDAPGFDDPLEMLEVCHGRIQAQCATLEKLRLHLPVHGCDRQAQQAAQAILRYFDTAGQHHHDDEEQDLFPLLLASGNLAAQQLIAHLLEKHTELNAAWENLRGVLKGIAAGEVAMLSDDIVRHFIAVYQTHIELENSQLLPLAKDLLTPAQIETLGRKMSARRGVVFSN
jgi:hemerythrin-like domain-containing protein